MNKRIKNIFKFTQHNAKKNLVQTGCVYIYRQLFISYDCNILNILLQYMEQVIILLWQWILGLTFVTCYFVYGHTMNTLVQPTALSSSCYARKKQMKKETLKKHWIYINKPYFNSKFTLHLKLNVKATLY